MWNAVLNELDWPYFIRFFGGLFAIASPIAAVPFFLGYTAGQSPSERTRSAFVATGTMAIAFAVVIVSGITFLNLFGISVAGFRLGGGFVILLSGLAMLSAKVGSMAVTDPEERAAEQSKLAVIFPFAIPLVVGPGAASTIIIGLHGLPGLQGYVVISVACLVLLILMYIALRLADPLFRVMGTLGMNILVRLMGLIIVVLAFETMAAGLVGLFPGLASAS